MPLFAFDTMVSPDIKRGGNEKSNIVHYYTSGCIPGQVSDRHYRKRPGPLWGVKDGGHLARRGTAEDPRHPPHTTKPPSTPGLEQRSPAAGCINEQAALKGTGSCNADEWSLQSRDERREQQERGGERRWGLGGFGRRGRPSGHIGSGGGRGKKGGLNFHLGVL